MTCNKHLKYKHESFFNETKDSQNKKKWLYVGFGGMSPEIFWISLIWCLNVRHGTWQHWDSTSQNLVSSFWSVTYVSSLIENIIGRVVGVQSKINPSRETDDVLFRFPLLAHFRNSRSSGCMRQDKCRDGPSQDAHIQSLQSHSDTRPALAAEAGKRGILLKWLNRAGKERQRKRIIRNFFFLFFPTGESSNCSPCLTSTKWKKWS